MNLIECTMKMKEESRAHYERLSEAVAGNELKRLFGLLAAAEAEHLALLKAMNDSLQPGAGGIGTLSEGVCVFRSQLDPENPGKALLHDPDGYRHVVAEEEEAIELYDQMAKESSDARMKKLSKALAEKEREHLEMVASIYAFVEEPRTYLEWGEFSNLRVL